MTDAKSSLLEAVRRMSASRCELPCSDFERLLAMDSHPAAVTEWSEVVTLTSEQVARWNARWMLSPTTSPDTVAAEELKRWENAYAATSDALVECVPNVRGALKERHELLLAAFLTEGRLKQSPGKLLPGLMSRTAHLAQRVGLSDLARRLMGRALYPEGSVGRADCLRADSREH